MQVTHDSYIERLRAFRSDPAVQSSAWDYLFARLQQVASPGSEDVLAEALLLSDRIHQLPRDDRKEHESLVSIYRQNLCIVAHELGVCTDAYAPFHGRKPLADLAMSMMVVIVAEHAARFNRDWDMLAAKPSPEARTERCFWRSTAIDKCSGNQILI